MCWVSWKKVCSSSDEGGLGIRDVECFNKTLYQNGCGGS